MTEIGQEAFQHIGLGWVDRNFCQYGRDTICSTLRKTKSWSEIQSPANSTDKNDDREFDGLSRNLSIKSNWSLTSASTIQSDSDTDDLILPILRESTAGTFDTVSIGTSSAWPSSDFKQTVDVYSNICDIIVSDNESRTTWSRSRNCAAPKPCIGESFSDSFSSARNSPPKQLEVPMRSKAEQFLSVPADAAKQRGRNGQRNLSHPRRNTVCNTGRSFPCRATPISPNQGQGDSEGLPSTKARDDETTEESVQHAKSTLVLLVERPVCAKASDQDRYCSDSARDDGIHFLCRSPEEENPESAVDSQPSEFGPPGSDMTTSSVMSFMNMHRVADDINDDLSSFTEGVVEDLAQNVLLQYSQQCDRGVNASEWARRWFRLEGTPRAMNPFFRPSSCVFFSCGHQTPPDSSRLSNNETAVSLATPSTSSNSNGTRRKHSRSEDSMDSDKETEEKNPKKHKPSESSIPKLFACPFAKYDKERYSERNVDEAQYRKCGTYMLRDISRLKQHLYRVHRRPEYYCPVCNQACESQGILDKHIRRRNCAERNPQLYVEKMTTDQMKEIKRRNKKETPVQNWFGIFKILFPEAPLPMSPYAGESSDEVIQNFVEFFRTVGPETMFELIRQRQEQNLMQPFSTSMQAIVDEAFEIAAPALLTAFDRQPRSEDSAHSDLRPAEIMANTHMPVSNNVLDMGSRCVLAGSGTLQYQQIPEGSFLQNPDSDFFEFGGFDPSLVDDAFDAYGFQTR